MQVSAEVIRRLDALMQLEAQSSTPQAVYDKWFSIITRLAELLIQGVNIPWNNCTEPAKMAAKLSGDQPPTTRILLKVANKLYNQAGGNHTPIILVMNSKEFGARIAREERAKKS